MADFRFYFIDAAERIFHAENHACTDDAAAEAMARALILAAEPAVVAIEVWDRARMIAAVKRQDAVP